MKFAIAGNGEQTQKIEQGTVGGFLLSVTSTTPANITIAVLRSIIVSVRLYRESLASPTIVVYGDLYSLAVASNPGSTEGLVLEGTVTDLIGFQIDPAGCWQLNNGDYLQVSLSVQGSVAGQITTISDMQVLGIEDITPTLTVQNVLSNTQTQDLICGDHVKALTIIETDDTARITGISLNSKNGWSCNYDRSEFAAFAANQFGAIATQTRTSAYNVYSGGSLHGLRGDLTVNTASTSNAAVVIFGGIADPVVAARAIETAQKIEARELNRALGKK